MNRFNNFRSENHQARKLHSQKSSKLSLAILLCSAATLPLVQARAQTLPNGGTVTAGVASIDTSSHAVSIAQSSSRAVIEWANFSVAQGNSVIFQQPGSQSATLNRVTGNTSSAISGLIKANGSVYLVNPNGIAITASGAVQTGGSFVASTLDISESDFMAGVDRFVGKGASGTVRNAGQINAGQGAYVALLGGAVANSGTISVPLGKMAMGSGEQISLDLNGDNFLQVAVPSALVAGSNAVIDNSGTITAAGGVVQLKAAVLKDAVRNIINMSGTISADSAVGDGGSIILIGGADTKSMAGHVAVTGSLTAQATGSLGKGGFVETSGAKVDLNSAKVSTRAANGAAGTWLIDPTDFTVAVAGGDISGTQLSANLANGNIRILSSQGAAGTGGDINVNDAVSWSTNTLTLDAYRDINVNAVMRATGTAGFVGVVGDTAQNGTGTVNGNLDFGMNSNGFYGRMDLAPTTSFRLNGTNYTIISALGAAGSLTGTDLQGINGSNTLTAVTGNYVLGTDIDASATAGWNSGTGFQPISTVGSGTRPFTGQFNGLGHIISNLTLNYSNRGNLGLFGEIGAGGSVTNVGLRGGSVTGQIGHTSIGALAGTSSGTIRNAFATTTVAGDWSVGGLIGRNLRDGKIFNAFATEAVNAIRTAGGGLVGENGGSIENAFATGDVTGTGGSASGMGGLVGYMPGGSIKNGFARGNVIGFRDIGGLVGEVRATNAAPSVIIDAYATGRVTANFGGYAGGLIGTAYGLNITRAYATGRVVGADSTIAGFVGYADNNALVSTTASYWDVESTGQTVSCGNVGCVGATALTTAQTMQASSFAGWNVDTIGGSGSNWRIYEGRTTPLLTPLLTPVYVAMPASTVNVVYTGADQTSAAGVTTRLAVNGDLADPARIFGTATSACSGGPGACVNAGSYTVTAPANLYSDQLGYDLIVKNPLSATLAIAPAPVTVTYSANAASGIYGNSPGALTGTVSASGLLNGDTLSGTVLGTAAWLTSATSASSVGTYAINGSGLSGNNSNYAFSFQQAAGNSTAYTITPRSIFVTANGATSVYGAGLPTLTYAVGGLGLVNGDLLSGALATSANTTSGVGSYAISQGTLANSNYAISFNGATHSITPAALTVSGLAGSRVYSGSAQTNGFTVTGLVGADQVTGVIGLAGGTNVGAYDDALSGATGVGLANYTISYANGRLTITPASLTITGNADSRVYTGLAQRNGFTVSGLLGTDSVTGVEGLAAGTNAGSYLDSLTGATGSGLGNYTITYANRGLTITPAPLTVTYAATAQSGTYGATPGTLSGTYDSVGLVNGETLASVLRGSAAWTTDATSTSGVGSYRISGAGLAAINPNYVVTFAQVAGNSAAYTVTARPISVTANDRSMVYGSALPSLTYVVGGLGLVNGDALTGALATSGTSLSNVGTYAITRGTLGNANYAITYTGANLSITPATLTITGDISRLPYNGLAQTNSFKVAGLFGNDQVTNVSGRANGIQVGTYADALSGATGVGLTNYTIRYVNGSLTITALPASSGLVPFLPFTDESGNGPTAPGATVTLCPSASISTMLREKGQAILVCAQ